MIHNQRHLSIHLLLAKMSSSNSIHGIMVGNCLTGPNFTNWLRNFKILLRYERTDYVLERKGPDEPPTNALEEDIWEYQKWKDDSTIVQCYMLASMSNELQRHHEDMQPRAMFLHLIELFAEQSRTQRYEISKNFFGAHLAESSSIQALVLKMIRVD